MSLVFVIKSREMAKKCPALHSVFHDNKFIVAFKEKK